MIEISVVIPTCDRNDLLVEAINSVIGQTYPAHEILVVNNGGHVLDGRLFPKFVKVLELPPYVGVSQARNYGTSLATSDYVAFLDDDDLWEKDYLSKVTKVIEEHQSDCIITRLDKLVDGKVYPYKNADGKLDMDTLLVENPGITGSSTIVHRDAFIRVSGYDEELRNGQDKALIIEFLINGYSIVAAPQIQAILRLHQGSRLGDAKSMVEGIPKFIKKYGRLMSAPQKNYNLVKILYYRYLVSKHPLDYFFYWFRFLIHYFNRKVDPTLPDPSRLPISKPLTKIIHAFHDSNK